MSSHISSLDWGGGSNTKSTNIFALKEQKGPLTPKY
jgi:hypothetical protein